MQCTKTIFFSQFGAEDSIRTTQPGHKSLEESYDAVVIANHEALTKLLDQVTIIYTY